MGKSMMVSPLDKVDLEVMLEALLERKHSLLKSLLRQAGLTQQHAIPWTCTRQQP